MKKSTRALSLFFAAVLALMLLPVAAFAAEEDRIAVYVQAPEDWSAPCLWAWADDGTNAFAAWPGGEMDADSANPGWYYCYIPKDTLNVIVNANEGAVQTTGEIKLEDRNAWITVVSPEDAQISYDQQTAGDIPDYVEKYAVHARVPADWADVSLWAWSDPDGKGAFETWPGKPMKAGENGWYTANVPIWVNSLIVSTRGGEIKTGDIKGIDPAEVWVTVAEDGTADFTYNDPDKADIPDITVHVSAPADWSAPCLWAWSAPDGTNVFSAWPGEPLEEDGNGWLVKTVPGWVNSIIVNANEGGVQTTDVSIEPGKDVWLTVAGPEDFALSYEEPAPASQEPAPTPQGSEPVPETQAPAPAQNDGNTGVLIAVAVIVVVAITVVCVVVVRKKKGGK